MEQGERVPSPRAGAGELPWEGCSEPQPHRHVVPAGEHIMLRQEWISHAYEDTAPLLFNFLVMLLQHQSLIRRGAA